MASLTDGAKVYIEDSRAALSILRKYMRADDRILEGGYKEYDSSDFQSALSRAQGPRSGARKPDGFDAQLKKVDLRKFVDDRFVKAK